MKSKTSISFYHFTITPLVLGLSKLIKKIYDTKNNLLVLCRDEFEMRELDKTLWTFASREFIPHGTSNEADAELQPVLFSTNMQSNKNNAEILLSCCDKVENLDFSFKKYLYASYGNTDEVQHMIDSYKSYKDNQDVETIFWRQERSGGWSKASF
ncbi:MAG: DNA polymerase III subunit chi [Rickettsiales bacterium]|nr:DNA polymerase III subunit chi [Rickettsiales bacterium]